jgi:hypothetical protein
MVVDTETAHNSVIVNHNSRYTSQKPLKTMEITHSTLYRFHSLLHWHGLVWKLSMDPNFVKRIGKYDFCLGFITLDQTQQIHKYTIFEAHYKKQEYDWSVDSYQS